MALKLARLDADWQIIYSENSAGEWVLWDVSGTGTSFTVPEQVAEIRKRAIARDNCPALNRVIIPAHVQTIHKDAIDGFGQELAVCCAHPSKPDGFFEGEYVEETQEDNGTYYMTHYGSWLCRSVVLRSQDAEGRLTWTHLSMAGELVNRPQVRWGYQVEQN